MKRLDLTGQRFGRLIAVSFNPGSFWKCQCDCGAVARVYRGKLQSGHTKSCGCLSSELSAERKLTHGHSRRISVARTYNIWRGMKRRCDNKAVRSYARYGGRGIRVCERWLDYQNFLADMGEVPSQTHSIERNNNDGNYEPGNCRWATPAEQNRNTRQNINITIDGKTMCAADWAIQFGLSAKTIRARIARGWSGVDAVLRPSGAKL